MRDEYDFGFAPQGWQCPICKRIYSPTYPWCIFCGNTTTTTATTTTKTIMINTDKTDWLEEYMKELEHSEETKKKEDFYYDNAGTSTAYKPKPNEKITVQW